MFPSFFPSSHGCHRSPSHLVTSPLLTPSRLTPSSEAAAAAAAGDDVLYVGPTLAWMTRMWRGRWPVRRWPIRHQWVVCRQPGGSGRILPVRRCWVPASCGNMCCPCPCEGNLPSGKVIISHKTHDSMIIRSLQISTGDVMYRLQSTTLRSQAWSFSRIKVHQPSVYWNQCVAPIGNGWGCFNAICKSASYPAVNGVLVIVHMHMGLTQFVKLCLTYNSATDSLYKNLKNKLFQP